MRLSTQEQEEIQRFLAPLHIQLDADQPHISGERFLMQREKAVLLGEAPGKKVVIKTSATASGKEEIRSEKAARDLLKKLAFAEENILFPTELYYGEIGDRLFLITEFIPQEKGFVEYSLEEQFFMTLRAFESQEAFHATTFEHLKSIRKIFPIMTSADYLLEIKATIDRVASQSGTMKIVESLNQSYDLLSKYAGTTDKYSNYLTHTDFTPNNFRVHGGRLYMLDITPEIRTVHFGNKYEGWARFLNYMVIHNLPLTNLLVKYIQEKRGNEDALNLRLMRIYKNTFLIRYYAESLDKTESDKQLNALTRERLHFWHDILVHLLEDKPIPSELVHEYKNKRDNLRSDEEKKRLKSAGLT